MNRQRRALKTPSDHTSRGTRLLHLDFGRLRQLLGCPRCAETTHLAARARSAVFGRARAPRHLLIGQFVNYGTDLSPPSARLPLAGRSGAQVLSWLKPSAGFSLCVRKVPNRGCSGGAGSLLFLPVGRGAGGRRATFHRPVGNEPDCCCL